MDQLNIKIVQKNPGEIEIWEAGTDKRVCGVLSARITLHHDRMPMAELAIEPQCLDIVVAASGRNSTILMTPDMVANWLMKRNFITAADRRFAEQLAEEIRSLPPTIPPTKKP